MAGIPSKAASGLDNKLKYNGKEEQRQEFSDGSGLEWMDYGARMYDAQVGRWNHVDVLAEKYDALSPFHFAYNNPLRFCDPNGKEIVNEAQQGSKEYQATENALQILKTTNPEAFKTLDISCTRFVVNYSKLNNEEAYKENYSGRFQWGVTNVDYETKGGLSVTNVLKNKNDDVLLAFFKRNLSFAEQEKMRSEGENPNGRKKPITQEEANDFVKLDGDVNIFLDSKLLEGNSKELTSILGHEFGHASFSITNTAIAWLWSVIGDIQKQGHDVNNPNGKAADSEEKKTRDGIKKIIK